MKYSLVLEGGGAKGAYQIGVVKALKEAGYEFDVVTGTSIGAINAAYIVQGDFEYVYHLWETLSFKDLFDVEEENLLRAQNLDINFDVVRYLTKKFGQMIKEKGIDTQKIRKIMEDSIDEEKIRKSSMNFGLVTYCLTDNTPQELFIEDIPKGKLVDYLMATSNLPVFIRTKIDDKNYIDGGAWDPCPIHMLEEKGYQNIITIRVFKRKSRIRGYQGILKRGKVKLFMIEPVEVLPSILNFDSKNLNELLKLGYYDGLRFLNHYLGYYYYIKSVQEETVQEMLKQIRVEEKLKLIKSLKINYALGENVHEVFLNKVLEELVLRTKQKYANQPLDALICILEEIARDLEIERFQIYSLEEWILMLKKSKKPKEISKRMKPLYDFLEILP